MEKIPSEQTQTPYQNQPREAAHTSFLFHIDISAVCSFLRVYQKIIAASAWKAEGSRHCGCSGKFAFHSGINDSDLYNNMILQVHTPLLTTEFAPHPLTFWLRYILYNVGTSPPLPPTSIMILNLNALELTSRRAPIFECINIKIMRMVRNLKYLSP